MSLLSCLQQDGLTGRALARSHCPDRGAKNSSAVGGAARARLNHKERHGCSYIVKIQSKDLRRLQQLDLRRVVVGDSFPC